MGLLVLFLLIGFLGSILWISIAAHRKGRDTATLDLRDPVGLVVAHTWYPKNHTLPEHGWQVVDKAYAVTYRGRFNAANAVLLIPSGRPVRGLLSLESDVYRGALIRAYGPDRNILAGSNRQVVNTLGEARQACRVMRLRKTRYVIVVASRPHLARVMRCWKIALREAGMEASVHFVAANGGPWWLYLREAISWWLEFLLPLDSKHRAWILQKVRGRP